MFGRRLPLAKSSCSVELCLHRAAGRRGDLYRTLWFGRDRDAGSTAQLVLTCWRQWNALRLADDHEDGRTLEAFGDDGLIAPTLGAWADAIETEATSSAAAAICMSFMDAPLLC